MRNPRRPGQLTYSTCLQPSAVEATAIAADEVRMPLFVETMELLTGTV